MAIFFNDPDKGAFSVRACGFLTSFALAGGIKKNLVLPTDSTSEQAFVRAAAIPQLNNSFGVQRLDEYVGTTTFQDILDARLLNPLGIQKRSQFHVSGSFNDESLAVECKRVEDLLQTREGRIDGAFLGVGKEDGHFGMHFPGVPFDTGVHVANVPEWMLAHNATYNGSGKDAVKLSEKGITLGAANFRNVDFVVVMGGPEKAWALKKAFFEPATSQNPLSFFQQDRERLGDNLIVLTWGSGYEGWKPDLTI